MIKISKTFVRPSTDIAWWHETAEAGQFNTLYGNSSIEQSPDGLSFTLTFTYDNNDQYVSLLASPVAKESIDRRMDYNVDRGIIEGPSSSVTI